MSVVGDILAPTLPVVQVVVLDDNLSVKFLQEPAKRVGRSKMESNARMAPEFGENDVLLADPELVEAERKSHSFQRSKCEEGNDDNVKKLLLMIGISSEKRVGVLGGVMSSVKVPEKVDIMHGSVVPVEPKVQNKTVEANLKSEPCPPLPVGNSVEWRDVAVVGEVNGQSNACSSDLEERRNDLSSTSVWDTITTVYIAVEKTILVTQMAEQVHLSDGDDVVHVEVDEEDAPRTDGRAAGDG